MGRIRRARQTRRDPVDGRDGHTTRRHNRVLWGVVATTTAVRLWFAWQFFGFLGGDDAEIVQEVFRGAARLDYARWKVRGPLFPDLAVAPIGLLGMVLGIHDTGHLAPRSATRLAH